jgi:uncharacterized protein (DUF2164 family)
LSRAKQPISLSDRARKQAIASIRRYVTENLDEEMGDLKASLMLDYILEEHGPTIYNQAMADARAFFEERAADLSAVGYQDEFPYWVKPKGGKG